MRKALLQAVVVTSLLHLCGCATTPAAGGSKRPPAEVRISADVDNERRIASDLRAVTARVRKGDGELLRASLLQQAEQDPKNWELQLQLGWMRAPSEQGWQDLKKLSTYNATNPWPYWAMGAIYLQWEDFADQASAEFDRALTLRKGFVPALVGKADVLRQKKQLEEAKDAYEAILAKLPDWVEAQRGLGLTLLALDDRPAARAALEKALAGDSDDFEALTALAKLATDENDYDAAIRHYKRLLDYTTRDRALRLELAQLHEKKGDLPGAAQAYEAAAKLGIDKPLLEALVAAYSKLKDPAKEAETLEKLAELDKADSAPLLRLAELRRAEGDDTGAETALRLAAERKPEDAALQLSLARLIAQREDLVASITAFRVAKQKGAAEAAAELAALETKAALAGSPASGDVNRIYAEISKRLNKLYEERRKENPKLKGTIQAQVSVTAEGTVESIEVLADSVNDPVVLANVYFNLMDAKFPKAKRTPTFEFVLAPR